MKRLSTTTAPAAASLALASLAAEWLATGLIRLIALILTLADYGHKLVLDARHREATTAAFAASVAALDMAERFGGFWGEHPQHEVGAWAEEIASEDTRLGYWEWVASRIDSGELDLD